MVMWTLEGVQRLRTVTGETLRPGGFNLTDRALNFCNFSDRSSILDAGCGIGTTTRHLKDCYEVAACGVDLSESLLAEARMQHGELPIIRARLEWLPFGDATFDGVICECVLSRTSIPQVLKEFSRILRDGSRLILSDLYRRESRKRERIKGSIDMDLMGRDQLITLLDDTNFQTLYWEDRSADLKKLAVCLVLKHGSLQGLFYSGNQSMCVNERLGDWLNLGYYLLIAKRINR